MHIFLLCQHYVSPFASPKEAVKVVEVSWFEQPMHHAVQHLFGNEFGSLILSTILYFVLM
jgi:hypothetical protein